MHSAAQSILPAGMSIHPGSSTTPTPPEMKTLLGQEILSHIREISDITMNVFKEYPYLYEGTEQEQWEYVDKRYCKQPNSVVCMASREGRLVGVVMGVPMNQAPLKYQTPFLNQGIDLSKLFYIGEMTILQGHRQTGVRQKLCEELKSHILKKGFYECITFCEIVRPHDDPKRPKNYHDHDRAWESLGFVKDNTRKTVSAWNENGGTQEIDHTMVYWLLDLKK